MVFQNPASTTVFEESIIVATLGITSDNESKYFVSKELEVRQHITVDRYKFRNTLRFNPKNC